MAPLKTRAPLDLDLEDKLIFGLTPVRFGYLAVGALAAYVLGAHMAVPGAFRVPLALVLLAAAAAVAWVRWRGRPLDAWLLDLAVFARRNLELEIDRSAVPTIRAPQRRLRQAPLPRVPTITVLGERPGVGATTVAVELGAALALKGRRVAVTQADGALDAGSRLGLASFGTHGRSGLAVTEKGGAAAAECVVLDLGSKARHRRADLALVVAAEGRAPASAQRRVRGASHIALVVNRDRENGTVVNPSGLQVATVVPDDPAVPAAQEAREPVILRFPASRAAMAFRLLADQIDPGTNPWQHPDSDRPRAG